MDNHRQPAAPIPGGIVPISPLPMTVNVSSRKVGPDGMVVLDLYTPQGHSAYYFDHETAKAVGEAMVQQAATAKTGIVVQRNGLARP